MNKEKFLFKKTKCCLTKKTFSGIYVAFKFITKLSLFNH